MNDMMKVLMDLHIEMDPDNIGIRTMDWCQVFEEKTGAESRFPFFTNRKELLEQEYIHMAYVRDEKGKGSGHKQNFRTHLYER